jgi:carbamoyltransferase
MRVLGISAFYHDSAAALIVDGEIVAAAQECLREAGLRLSEIDYFVFYEKPFVKFERLLETYFATAPRGFKSFRMSIPLWLQEKLFQKNALYKKLSKAAPGIDWESKLLFSEHHLSHAASAFFPSPFESAAVLTMDGVGEWTTTSLMVGRGNTLTSR